jgi:hypothetical protein
MSNVFKMVLGECVAWVFDLDILYCIVGSLFIFILDVGLKLHASFILEKKMVYHKIRDFSNTYN